MNTWQLQEAKAKLTQCVLKAQQTPQVISRHGVPEVVMVSMETYRKLTHASKSVVALFRDSPLYDVEIDIARDISSQRYVDL